MGMPIFRERVMMAKKKGYKFTNKSHSQKSVMSTVFGALSSISLIVVIYLTYLRAGAAPVNYGIAGILVLLFAVIGLVLAVLSLQEKENFKLFAYIGLGLNILVLAGISGILYAGSYL